VAAPVNLDYITGDDIDTVWVITNSEDAGTYYCEGQGIAEDGTISSYVTGGDLNAGNGLDTYWNTGTAPSITHITQIPKTETHISAGMVLLGYVDSVSCGVIILENTIFQASSVLKVDTTSQVSCYASWRGDTGGTSDEITCYSVEASTCYNAAYYRVHKYVTTVAEMSSTVSGYASVLTEDVQLVPIGTMVAPPLRLNDRDYLLCGSDQESQPATQESYFLVGDSATLGNTDLGNYERAPIISRFMYTTATVVSDAVTAVVRGNKLVYALPYKQRVEKVSNTQKPGVTIAGVEYPAYFSVDYYTSISLVAIDLDSSLAVSRAELGDNLHLGGGFVYNFDGRQIAEHGFFTFPGNNAIAVPTTGGSLTVGTYLYKFLYEYVDYSGQVHRSAASQTFSVTTSGGNLQTDIFVESPVLTNREDTQNVKVVTYRTIVGGSDVFYRVRSDLAYNPTLGVGTVNFTDNASDSSITANEVLYTAGGEYDNDPPVCSSLLAQSKNRLWAVDEWGELWYSKEWRRGEAVGFSLFLTKTVPQFGGRPRALATLDDKTVIFKESNTFIVTGDGPQPNGLNDTFSLATELPHKVGCSYPKSIVEIDDGLLFKSERGIYLLGRGMDMRYVGSGVHAYNGLDIRAAVHIPDKSQVRFTTSDGATLVYDYEQRNQNGIGAWSTFTNLESLDAVLQNGVFTLLRTNGQVWGETSGYLDIATPIELRVQTGWIAFAGLQGWKRVYRVLLLGEKKSDHTLNMSFAYNYEDTEHQYVTFDTTALDAETFGDASPFGAGSFGGNGDGDIYQFRVGPSRQQCTSIRVTIWDSGQSGTGESMTLTDLSAELGGIFGSTRLSSGRSG
jgi:hypothetical protein